MMKKFLAASALTAVGAVFMAGPAAAADSCELSISGNDQMQFNKSELVVPADCDEVTLTLEHTGKMPVAQMGHNWVLSKEADKQAITSEGMQAGLDNEYLPDDDKIIAHTDLIGGGESSSVTFSTADLKAGGDYSYYCTFPGHSSMMHGKLIVK
ncbi:azurin [Salinisphaera sp.]|uniref:azurin n=1 Tax=Salinisphaera sp. TaxID=1914330 RepID=UPI000C527CB7|nr:azurin [Salinisphaera sp.]